MANGEEVGKLLARSANDVIQKLGGHPDIKIVVLIWQEGVEVNTIGVCTGTWDEAKEKMDYLKRLEEADGEQFTSPYDA